MYKDFFGIEETPFSIIPDPRYLYMSPRYQEALAHLLYGVEEEGGFVLLTGEVGTGKTTITRSLMEQLPEKVDLALIINPRLSELELMSAICDELGVAYPEDTESLKVFFDIINTHLLKTHGEGRQCILLIDEAQNLSVETLELIRLLTNLETSKHKLMRIILVGQPELGDILRRSDLRQLAQRITARFHLDPLDLGETRAYINHRLQIGGLSALAFAPSAIKLIHQKSKGIPRLINAICDRCLLGAYVAEQKKVTRAMAFAASEEVLGKVKKRSFSRHVALLVALIVIVGVAILFRNTPLTQLVQKITETSSTVLSQYTPPPAPADTTETETETTALQPDAPAVSNDAPADTPAMANTTDTPADTTTDTAADVPSIAQPSEPVENTDTPTETLPDDATFARLAENSSLEKAFASLLQRWQQDYAKLDGLSFCAKAANAKLTCLNGAQGTRDLPVINRPAIVTLSAPDGQAFYGVVESIQADTYTLDVAGWRIFLNAEKLSAMWSGAYLLLWQSPEIFTRHIAPGISGQDVAWADKLLRAAGYGTDTDTPSQTYTDELKTRVVAFQRDHHLVGDGIIGPQTVIRLIALGSARTGPFLTQPPEPLQTPAVSE